jgi:hypothetical protein
VNINTNWIAQTIANLGLTVGTNAFYNALTSTGFAVSYQNKNFEALLNEVYGSLDSGVNETISDIIVCGGFNDGYLSNYNDIVNAITSFVDNAKNKFPHAKVHIGHIGWSSRQSDKSKLAAISIPAYRYCEQLGAHYIENSEFLLHDYSLIQSDTTHPNENGAIYIGKGIANYIKYGHIIVSRVREVPTLTPSHTVSEIRNTFFITQYNDCTTIELYDIQVSFPLPYTLEFGNYIPIATLNSNYVKGGDPEEEYLRIPCTIVGTATNTNAFNLPGFIVVNGNELQLFCFAWRPDTHSTTIELNSLTIYGQTFIAPTVLC